MLQTFLYRYEKFLFIVLVLIHLIPVCCTHFFPTLDGPAHLYNSNLINWMLSEGDGLANHFFYFNPQPVPNLSGHIMLCMLNFFLPAYLAEKMLMISYIILLPVCFRLLVKQIIPCNLLISYLIFPFIYSYFFYEGFFNFCLSLPIYFYTLFYWFKFRERMRLKNGVVLLLLFSLLYFSHLLSFLFAFGSIAFFILWNALFKQPDKTGDNGSNTFLFLKQAGYLLTGVIPSIIMSIDYLSEHMHKNNAVFLSKENLMTLITQVKPLLTLSYSLWIPWLFLFLLAVVFTKKWQGRKDKKFFSCNDSWLVLMILSLMLLFLVPDQTATGGFVSVRITLFVYLTCILWLATQPIPKSIVYFSVLFCIFISVILLRFYKLEAMELDKIAEQYEQAAAVIPENSIVLPLNYTDRLMSSNMLTYIGSEKRILVLDNYEALTQHFPLKWKKEYQPDSTAGNYLKSSHPRVDIQQLEKRLGRKINYVVRGCYQDSVKDASTLYVNKQLEEGYEVILKKEYVRVYKRKE